MNKERRASRCWQVATQETRIESSGSTLPEGPVIKKSVIEVIALGSVLISAMRAPDSFATYGIDAAGNTTPDVPIIKSSSHSLASTSALESCSVGNDSPKNTTSGRIVPLHEGHRGTSVRTQRTKCLLVGRLPCITSPQLLRSPRETDVRVPQRLQRKQYRSP